jgi:hypothetical protein
MALLNGNKQTLDNNQLQAIKDEINNNPEGKDYAVLTGQHNGVNVRLLAVRPMIANPDPQVMVPGPELLPGEILRRAKIGIADIVAVQGDDDGAKIWDVFMGLPSVDLNSALSIDFLMTMGPTAAEWVPNQAYNVGAFVTPTTGNGDGVFMNNSLVPGQSGADEPAWPGDLEEKIADNTIEWKRLSGKNGKGLLAMAKLNAIAALSKIPDPEYQALIPGQNRTDVILGEGYKIEGEDLEAVKAL